MKALTITILCVDSNLPKKKKKKKIVDFYSWYYRCKVVAGSPKELPRIPIFAWVLK
jgi:hypothetical protein